MNENEETVENNEKEVVVIVDRGTPMLTTFDNPFNPFTQFNEWLLCDNRNEHNCLAYLDRTARTSSSLSDAENNRELEEAIDRLIEADFLHIYRKVFYDDFVS